MRAHNMLILLTTVLSSCYAPEGDTPSNAAKAGAAGQDQGSTDPTQGTTGGTMGGGVSNPNTPADGNTQTPGAPCANSKLQVCDSFETVSANAAPDKKFWTVKTQSAGDTVTVDATRFHSGKQSLHAHTQAGGYEVADIVNATVVPNSNNLTYGRAFIYMEKAMPSTHITLVAAGSPLPSNNYAWTRYGGQFAKLMANWAPDSGTESWQHATDALPLNQWVCIQWMFNGATTQSRFWVNDAAVTGLSINTMSADAGAPTSVWSLPQINAVTLGWEHYPSDSGTDGMDIWYDDVALDSNFITCNQ